jgi:hypothetical protein
MFLPLSAFAYPNVLGLVNFIFYWQPMTIPSETTFDEMARLRGITCDNVLDGAGKNVAIVWQSGGEWRSIVEGVFGFTFAFLDRSSKGILQKIEGER